uniref:Uncharacterized protein n=1 Tax=Globisporangium ultimum (strain ATCC 200006 / CBS 805.95 / DAOM BR144) TaxID=431595 RepID=K3WNP0_GLOUD
MWIPARDLTSTFSDTEIMTSLGFDQKSTLWANSIVHLRDFKVIRGKGVSFTCTDREICTKLGSQGMFWQQVYLSEFDLLLQIMGSSVYMGPLKAAEMARAPPSVVPHSLLHFWDDRTLALLLQSSLV